MQPKIWQHEAVLSGNVVVVECTRLQVPRYIAHRYLPDVPKVTVPESIQLGKHPSTALDLEVLMCLLPPIHAPDTTLPEAIHTRWVQLREWGCSTDFSAITPREALLRFASTYCPAFPLCK
eukprot:TRINITY_DN14482_c0_g1_i1.p1 TRINITY_DN14482_c0_g1~~TRINITY_DN14482_c0_g1_i1.p1  ORF type:complete len:121 (+),score=13.98 TRINITY_DN14482_c0_g1_i1:425-787(+)